MKSKSLGYQKSNILFGFDPNLDRFVPSHEPSHTYEACIEVRVAIPKYMSNDFFITHYYKLVFIKRYGLDFTRLKSEDALERFMQLSGISLFIAVRLLETRKKSAFLTSCVSSLKKWLTGSSDFDHPWSGKQLIALEKIYSNEYRIKFYSISKNINVISSFT